MVVAAGLSGCGFNSSDDNCDWKGPGSRSLPAPPSGQCPSRADALPALVAADSEVISVDSDGMLTHLSPMLTCSYELAYSTGPGWIDVFSWWEKAPGMDTCPPSTDPSVVQAVEQDYDSLPILAGPMSTELPAEDVCFYDVTFYVREACPPPSLIL
jgi:hypothetical protein